MSRFAFQHAHCSWRGLFGCSVLLGALLVTADDARPQEIAYGTVSPDSALARTLRSMAGEPISLEDAVRRALAASPELEEARAGLRAADAARRRERGAFDPELFASVEVSDAESPTSSSFEQTYVLEDRTVASRFGARALFPIGTSLTATVDAEKNETNSAFQSLDPMYRATGRLEVRQPLLRGFGPGARGPLSAAERRAEAERLRLDQAERDLRADSETLYWELYAAERDYAVQELIVDQASAFLEQASVRAEAGLIGPDQVANAQVFLAQQKLALLDQEERLDGASDRLAEKIGTAPSPTGRTRAGGDLAPAALGERRYHAIDAPAFADPGSAPVPLDFERLRDRTLAGNSAIAAAHLELAALEAAARSGGWNALPRLDLVGSLGGSGLAGVPRSDGTDQTRTGNGLGDALEESLTRDYPSWTVGFELSLPLGLRAGRAERDRARAEAARQRARIGQLRLGVERDLRDALRRYHNGATRLELAREAAAAASEQVRIGLIEFDNGRSTAFELVRLAADLASAQQELSRALVRTATARADLSRLVGSSDEPLFDAVGSAR